MLRFTSHTGIRDFMSALLAGKDMRTKCRESVIVWRRDHNGDYAVFTWSEWLDMLPSLIRQNYDPSTVTLLPYQKYGRN